ncbi:hypothetical protein PGB28_02115 [Primorskyibacter aestuariivivens]|uniref:hypothetical protein n=1 Tax=Primorskyibacter aestuariivivens TaxID=1888912 RepID=UPI0022FFE525|nr:hypothetical protein [Primorskyibacter aestuariivivens]MDA7427236.1 hypothetical protein [Primorskyibacter aestuariivivens]
MGDLGWRCLGSPSRSSPITTETTNSTTFKAQDRVRQDLLLKAFAEASGVNNKIWLELSFKDRELIGQIADSVVFWAPHIDTGANDLKV